MVVNHHESLDWWSKMAPVFEEYLADSYLCDLWFVCSDRIVSSHKLVLAQLGDWDKRSSTFWACLENEESFITLDGWSGDQVTQMLIEIYNTETKSLGSETKVLLHSLGIKFEENFKSQNLEKSFNSDIISHNLDISDESDKSPTMDNDSDIDTCNEEGIKNNVTNHLKNETDISLDVFHDHCILCSCNLMSHSKISEKSKLEYICCIESCKSHFSFTADFVRHMNEHVETHLDKEFSCEECETEFTSKHLLDKHNKDLHLSSVKITFNCLYEGCDYKAKCKQTLESHTRDIHLGIKKKVCLSKDTTPMECPCCMKNMKVWYYEKYHKKTCGENSVVYQCEICNKSGFVNSVTLQNHVRAVHSDEKPFVCEHCDKAFARSESLSKHRAINHGVNHKGELIARRLYSCDYCGKLLSSKTKLVGHVKVVHEGVKDFKCKFCDKTFGSKNNLDVHEGAVHTGKLPYQCYFCNKSFSRKNRLDDHQKNSYQEKYNLS